MERRRNLSALSGPERSAFLSNYKASAHTERAEYLADLVARGLAATQAKRRFVIFAAAFVVAAGAFWATMLTSPPTTEAALSAGINPAQAATNLPSFDDSYQRHMGVLDILASP